MSSGAPILIRVWLPDRPGALGLVASRIGALRGDIVGVDVLERADGIAIDEVAVILPERELVEMLVHEVEQVDGVSVAEVRDVASFPDSRLDAIEGAARLLESVDVDQLHRTLVDQVQREFLAEWSALTADRVLARSGPVPDAEVVAALEGGASSRDVLADAAGSGDVAVAHLPTHDATALVGRSGPFRRSERAQLTALARVADRAWTLLAAGSSPALGSSPAEPAPTAISSRSGDR